MFAKIPHPPYRHQRKWNKKNWLVVASPRQHVPDQSALPADQTKQRPLQGGWEHRAAAFVHALVYVKDLLLVHHEGTAKVHQPNGQDDRADDGVCEHDHDHQQLRRELPTVLHVFRPVNLVHLPLREFIVRRQRSKEAESGQRAKPEKDDWQSGQDLRDEQRHEVTDHRRQRLAQQLQQRRWVIQDFGQRIPHAAGTDRHVNVDDLVVKVPSEHRILDVGIGGATLVLQRDPLEENGQDDDQHQQCDDWHVTDDEGRQRSVVECQNPFHARDLGEVLGLGQGLDRRQWEDPEQHAKRQ
mmetsp:Transcript_25470/g.71251  ORF Transcript_25470/g.71251 Transcript_25470/m.71251 type:complete len:298 (-) Transcript_25470:1535-2428(-)